MTDKFPIVTRMPFEPLKWKILLIGEIEIKSISLWDIDFTFHLKDIPLEAVSYSHIGLLIWNATFKTTVPAYSSALDNVNDEMYFKVIDWLIADGITCGVFI